MQAKSSKNKINLDQADTFLLTFHDFMEKALYDTSFGYYSSGAVKFEVDFDTYAEEYAPLLADRFLLAWRGMRETNLIGPDEKFYIYEFAAGSGKMALRFLHYTKGKSATHPHDWLAFYNNLSYVIGEISPTLVEKQKQLLHHFIRLNKVAIHTLNAINADSRLPAGKGVVLSNELLDALPVEEVVIKREQNGELSYAISVTAPTVPKKLFEEVKTVLPKILDAIQQPILIDMKILEIWRMPWKLITKIENDQSVIISKELMSALLSPRFQQRYGSKIKMEKWAVPLSDFAETYRNNFLHRFLNKSAVASQILQEHRRDHLYYYLPYGTAGYLDNIKQFLQSGYIFTLDYGHHVRSYLEDVAAGKIFLRTFSKQYQTNQASVVDGNVCFTSTNGGSPLDHVGEKDITMEVDFTDFVEIGLEKGMTPIYFGTQDSLGGYYIQQFCLLIQEYNLPASPLLRHSMLFEDMLPSGPIRLDDMSGLKRTLEPAQTCLGKWEQTIIRRDKKETIVIFFTILDALKDNNYSHTNYVLWRGIEIKLRQLLCDALMSDLINHTQINELLTHNEGRNYAEILLLIIRHHLWSPHPPGHEQAMLRLDNFLSPIAKTITRMFPDLDKKSLNAKTLKPYNFSNMPPDERKATMLSVTLTTAARLLQQEVSALETAPSRETTPAAGTASQVQMWPKPAAKPTAASTAAPNAAATTTISSQQNAFGGLKSGFLL
jgi:SAM-dependent MidA family methyltransferase